MSESVKKSIFLVGPAEGTNATEELLQDAIDAAAQTAQNMQDTAIRAEQAVASATAGNGGFQDAILDYEEPEGMSKSDGKPGESLDETPTDELQETHDDLAEKPDVQTAKRRKAIAGELKQRGVQKSLDDIASEMVLGKGGSAIDEGIDYNAILEKGGQSDGTEILEKAKYVKRTGTPGHYQYEYADDGSGKEAKHHEVNITSMERFHAGHGKTGTKWNIHDPSKPGGQEHHSYTTYGDSPGERRSAALKQHAEKHGITKPIKGVDFDKQATKQANAGVSQHPSDSGKAKVVSVSGPMEVDVAHRAGNFITHKSTLSGSKGYMVTHASSGQALSEHKSAEEAKAMANHMNAMAGDALSDLKFGQRPTKQHADGRDKLSAARLSFREQTPLEKYNEDHSRERASGGGAKKVEPKEKDMAAGAALKHGASSPSQDHLEALPDGAKVKIHSGPEHGTTFERKGDKWHGTYGEKYSHEEMAASTFGRPVLSTHPLPIKKSMGGLDGLSEYLEKGGGGHKYTKRTGGPGNYKYEYADDGKVKTGYDPASGKERPIHAGSKTVGANLGRVGFDAKRDADMSWLGEPPSAKESAAYEEKRAKVVDPKWEQDTLRGVPSYTGKKDVPVHVLEVPGGHYRISKLSKEPGVSEYDAGGLVTRDRFRAHYTPRGAQPPYDPAGYGFSVHDSLQEAKAAVEEHHARSTDESVLSGNAAKGTLAEERAAVSSFSPDALNLALGLQMDQNSHLDHETAKVTSGGYSADSWKAFMPVVASVRKRPDLGGGVHEPEVYASAARALAFDAAERASGVREKDTVLGKFYSSTLGKSMGGLDGLNEYLAKGGTPVGGITPGGYKKVAEGQYVKQGEGSGGSHGGVSQGGDNEARFRAAYLAELEKEVPDRVAEMAAENRARIKPFIDQIVYRSARVEEKYSAPPRKDPWVAAAYEKLGIEESGLRSFLAASEANVEKFSSTLAAEMEGVVSEKIKAEAERIKSGMPQLADRMIAALKRGGANNSNAMKRAAKKVGATGTLSGLKVFLTAPPSTTEKSMLSGLDALEAFAKGDLPSGESKLDQGHGDASPNGGDLTSTPRPKAEGAASPSQDPGAPSVPEEKLSEDDDAIGSQLKGGEPGPKEQAVAMGKSLQSYSRQELDQTIAREKAAWEANLRKGQADVVVGVGIAAPQTRPEALEKAQYSTQGEDARVLYSNASDLACERLFKSDNFYQGGEPSLGFCQPAFTRMQPCGSCGGQMSKSLSACPHCGVGATVPEFALSKAEAPVPVQNRRGPGLRPARGQADLVLPNGVKLGQE